MRFSADIHASMLYAATYTTELTEITYSILTIYIKIDSTQAYTAVNRSKSSLKWIQQQNKTIY